MIDSIRDTLIEILESIWFQLNLLFDLENSGFFRAVKPVLVYIFENPAIVLLAVFGLVGIPWTLLRTRKKNLEHERRLDRLLADMEAEEYDSPRNPVHGTEEDDGEAGPVPHSSHSLDTPAGSLSREIYLEDADPWDRTNPPLYEEAGKTEPREENPAEGEWTQDATDSVLPPVDPPASASFDQPQDEKEFLDSLNSAASDVAGPADPEPDSWSWMEEEWDWPGSARPTEPASPPEEDPAAQEDKDSPAISSPQDLQVQLERTLEKLSGHFGEDEGPSSLAPGNADLEEGAIPPLFDSKSPPPETPGDAGERTGSAEASADTPPVPSRSHSALLIERLKKLQAHLETRFRSLPSHPEPAAPDASSDSGTPGERVYDAARLGRPGTGKSKKDTEDYLDVLESFVFVQSQKNEP